jgi:hypothetical protein
LVVRLSDIRTRPWIGQASFDITAPGSHELSLGRREFCKDSDPCHALYDVSWQARDPGASTQRPSFGDVTRYTRYRVTLTLGALTLTYDAAIVYHDLTPGTARPEVLDPLIPGLDKLAGDRAPLAKAPWSAYTKTRRYAALMQKVSALPARSAASSMPIGYLMGDDVTAQDESSRLLLTASSCSEADCACGSSGGATNEEWDSVRVDFPNLTRDRICKTGNATETYNCLAWTLNDTSRWWWSEADANLDLKISRAEFDAFYANRGINSISYYGPSTADIKHVAKTTGGSGSACSASSKIGANIRMSHDLDQLAGGLYGSRQGGR